MTDNNIDMQTIHAFPVNGVGGFITGTPNGGVHAVMSFRIPSGELLHLDLTDELLSAVESKAGELRAELIGVHETLRDLGL